MSIERTPLHQDPVVIVSAARTPMGGFQGDLQSLSATELGSIAIRGPLSGQALKVQTCSMCCLVAFCRRASVKRPFDKLHWGPGYAMRRCAARSTRCAVPVCRPQSWPMTC